MESEPESSGPRWNNRSNYLPPQLSLTQLDQSFYSMGSVRAAAQLLRWLGKLIGDCRDMVSMYQTLISGQLFKTSR